MKQAASKCVHALDTFIDWTGRLISYGEYIMMFVLIYEVISRYFFHAPTIWASELSMYVFGAVGVLSGAYVLKNDAHIRVDIFYGMYKPRMKAIVNIIAVFFILFWCYLLISYGWPYFWKTLMRNELSITTWRAPLWPIRLCIPVGAGLCGIAAISQLIKNIYILVKGEEL